MKHTTMDGQELIESYGGFESAGWAWRCLHPGEESPRIHPAPPSGVWLDVAVSHREAMFRIRDMRLMYPEARVDYFRYDNGTFRVKVSGLGLEFEAESTDTFTDAVDRAYRGWMSVRAAEPVKWYWPFKKRNWYSRPKCA